MGAQDSPKWVILSSSRAKMATAHAALRSAGYRLQAPSLWGLLGTLDEHRRSWDGIRDTSQGKAIFCVDRIRAEIRRTCGMPTREVRRDIDDIDGFDDDVPSEVIPAATRFCPRASMKKIARPDPISDVKCLDEETDEELDEELDALDRSAEENFARENFAQEPSANYASAKQKL